MLELYYFEAATCGRKVRMVLEEKHLTYTHRILDREAGDLRSPEYLKLNPNGYVPTLVHDGAVIIESSVIMTYLEDAFDDHPLRAETPLRRARMNMWLKRADECLLALGSVTYATANRNKILKKPEVEREAYFESIDDPKRRNLLSQVVESGVKAPVVAASILALDALLNRMNEDLADHSLLVSSSLTLADCAVAPFVSRLNDLGMDAMWTDRYPRVGDWWDHIRKRPSFETGVKDKRPAADAAAMRDAGTQAWPQLMTVLENGAEGTSIR